MFRCVFPSENVCTGPKYDCKTPRGIIHPCWDLLFCHVFSGQRFSNLHVLHVSPHVSLIIFNTGTVQFYLWRYCVRFFQISWVIAKNAVIKISDKKHVVWCSSKSHDSSKVRQKSVQWYPLSFFFECRFISGYQWPNLGLNRYFASS